MRPRVSSKSKVHVSMDDVTIRCPDCGSPLLVTESHVPTSNNHRRNAVEVEGLCLNKCRQYKHLVINLPGVHDKRNSCALPQIATRPEHRPIQLSDLRIIHSPCGRNLNRVQFPEFRTMGNTLVATGYCGHCQYTPTLVFSEEGLGDLSKDNFWITCPDCQYDVFLDRLSLKISGNNVELHGHGRCSTACGFRQFSLTVKRVTVPEIAAV